MMNRKELNVEEMEQVNGGIYTIHENDKGDVLETEFNCAPILQALPVVELDD